MFIKIPQKNGECKREEKRRESFLVHCLFLVRDFVAGRVGIIVLREHGQDGQQCYKRGKDNGTRFKLVAGRVIVIVVIQLI